MARLRRLIDNAYACDPRIARYDIFGKFYLWIMLLEQIVFTVFVGNQL